MVKTSSIMNQGSIANTQAGSHYDKQQRTTSQQPEFIEFGAHPIPPHAYWKFIKLIYDTE